MARDLSRVPVRHRLSHPIVLWLSLLPFGFGCCVPLYAGLRSRHPTVFALGLAATLAFVGGCLGLALSGPRSTGAAVGIGTTCWLLSWALAVGGGLAARDDYEDQRELEARADR